MGVQPGGDQERGRQRRLAFERGASRCDQRLLTPGVARTWLERRDSLANATTVQEALPDTQPGRARRTQAHLVSDVAFYVNGQLIAGEAPLGPPRRAHVIRLRRERRAARPHRRLVPARRHASRPASRRDRPREPSTASSSPGAGTVLAGSSEGSSGLQYRAASETELFESRRRTLPGRFRPHHAVEPARSPLSSPRRSPRSTIRFPPCGSAS